MNLDFNLDEIYHTYLDEIDKEKQKQYPQGNFFRASSAGMCHRKHYFKSIGEKGSDKDSKSIRLFRLGTLIHEDLQKALIKAHKEHKDLLPAINIYVEEEYRIPEWNVIGHVDFVLETKEYIYVYEFKTINSYKWKMMFGRDRDKNPSVNYEIQLSTNALGMEKKTNKPSKMFMVYYKKDTSDIKIIEVPDHYKIRTKEYWEDVNITVKEIKKNPELINLVKPEQQLGIPVSSWECNEKYCDFHHLCFGG